jgi:hypothetical protein
MNAVTVPLSACERGLLDRAARWSRHGALRELTAEALRALAGREGVDFATAVLYDRLRRSTEHGPAIDRLEAGAEPTPEELGPVRATVAVVPGAFYVEYPHTGADGRLVRAEAARFGCRTALLPLPSLGPPADNARRICDWLIRRGDETAILVSLSKGGADVKLALARPEAERAFRNVPVWVNLSGIVHGTPLADWLLARPLRSLLVRLLLWYRGLSFAVIRELRHGQSDGLDGPLRLPGRLRAIHVVGFPLRRHLTSRLARRGFRRLSPLGPNDAGALLADACRLPGVVYPVWGADHYLRPAGRDMRGLFARVLRYVCQEGLLPATSPA